MNVGYGTVSSATSAGLIGTFPLTGKVLVGQSPTDPQIGDRSDDVDPSRGFVDWKADHTHVAAPQMPRLGDVIEQRPRQAASR
jgi:hypothetical protein